MILLAPTITKNKVRVLSSRSCQIQEVPEEFVLKNYTKCSVLPKTFFKMLFENCTRYHDREMFEKIYREYSGTEYRPSHINQYSFDNARFSFLYTEELMTIANEMGQKGESLDTNKVKEIIGIFLTDKRKKEKEAREKMKKL